MKKKWMTWPPQKFSPSAIWSGTGKLAGKKKISMKPTVNLWILLFNPFLKKSWKLRISGIYLGSGPADGYFERNHPIYFRSNGWAESKKGYRWLSAQYFSCDCVYVYGQAACFGQRWAKQQHKSTAV